MYKVRKAIVRANKGNITLDIQQVMQTRFMEGAKVALILCVPFWAESVHEILSRIG